MAAIKGNDKMAIKKERKRWPKFTESEIEILVDECLLNKKLLRSNFDENVTNQTMKEFWVDTTKKINMAGKNERPVDKVQIKWSHLKSETLTSARKKKNEARKTGGGEAAPVLTDIEQKILQFVGEMSLYGITGGLVTGNKRKISDKDKTLKDKKEKDDEQSPKKRIRSPSMSPIFGTRPTLLSDGDTVDDQPQQNVPTLNAGNPSTSEVSTNEEILKELRSIKKMLFRGLSILEATRATAGLSTSPVLGNVTIVGSPDFKQSQMSFLKDYLL